MMRFQAGSLCLLLVLGLAFRPMGQTQEKPSGRVIQLTPKLNGETVKVRAGDTLALKLPIRMLFEWELADPVPELKDISLPLTLKRVDGTDSGQTKTQKGSSLFSRRRYEVLAIPKKPTVTWVYSPDIRRDAKVKAQPVQRTKPLPKVDEPDMTNEKPGVFFEVKLIVQD
jgi:hypothetical protein